ncbi:MAG: biotin/lipoyl-binding protein [Caldilineaceae bacterium]
MVYRKLTLLCKIFSVSVALLALTSCRVGRATPTPIPINLPGQLTTSNVVSAVVQETYTVQRGEVIQEEILTGRVAPIREEDLFFGRSGRVTEVYVEDGDQVQTGDIIAILDNDILELDLESALIGLAIAKENYSQAQGALAYRRQQAELNLEISKLLAGNQETTLNLPSNTPRDSVAQVRDIQVELSQLSLAHVGETIDPVLELNVKRAELSVERVKQSILEGQIEAPFEGEVRFIGLPEDGEQLAVQAFAAVARLVDTSQFKIELNLPRTQLEALTEGMAVEVSAASLGENTLPGVIAALPRPFGTSQGSLTEVVLANAEDNQQLREGITVAITVRLKSKPDALVIPRAALREDNGIYYVTVQEGEETRRVTIAVGVVANDLVEVIAGLEEGQQVVGL